jgi:AcrR family transcriptional regulator
MVHLVVASSQPRNRLLTAAIDHALDEGIADQSLREIAAAIGTSHRMLIYHFGSREGLLIAVTREIERRQRDALLDVGVSEAGAWETWKRLSKPNQWPTARLFFELYSRALLGRPGTDGFLDGIVDSWVGPVTDAMIEAGADKHTARVDARLGVAVARGLLLDLLATGDRREVDRAYKRFLQFLLAAQPSPTINSDTSDENEIG